MKINKRETKRLKRALKRAKLKAQIKVKKMKITPTVTAIIITAAALTGCQTADPASRSNRTSYRDIVAAISGTSNTLSLTIGDGLYASADGGGDTTSSTPTQSTDTSTPIDVMRGTGGGSTWGAFGAGLDTLINAIRGTSSAADTATACPDGDPNCADTP